MSAHAQPAHQTPADGNVEALRLLIVDDDAVDRMAVRRLIVRSELAGATIEEAADLESTLERLSHGSRDPRIDCVLLDYSLVGDTGLDVLREMSARSLTTPVVMLTGQSDPQTAAALIKAGADDFLTKDSLSGPRLAQAIRGAVRVGRAERAAAETSERLAATLRSIADAVITLGLDQRITYFNEAAEALTGWPTSEALGRPLSEVAMVRGAGPHAASLHEYIVEEVIAGRVAAQRTDLALVRRDGKELQVDVTATALRDVRGTATGAVIAIRDITARKNAEAELASANQRLQKQTLKLAEQASLLEQQVEESLSLTEELEHANDQLQEAILDAERARGEADAARVEVETLSRIGSTLASEHDVERIVQTVTDAATSLTGAQFGAFFYNVVDRDGGKLTLYTLSGAPREAFQNFGHPRPTQVFAPTFYGTDIVRSDDITKDPRYGQEGPHYGMPKGHLPVRSYLAVPVISRSGDAIGGLFFGHADVGVFDDRAERLATGVAAWAAVAMDNARLYEAERKARAEAELANKAKSEFLANMSHELRTPLNAIGGYTDLITTGVRGPISDIQRADLDRVKRNQVHLLSLINDILNFAKIEAGRVRMNFRDVSMNKALGELEALISPQLLEKQITYEYQCCDESYTAYVDPERLQQILLNLLSNAVKFTPAGGRISVICGARPDTMHVDVKDTGIGMPADKLENIFEPFVQLDRGQSSSNAGTGLGLSISRDLARAMGGDLTATSTLDRGSTFRLTLPRRAPA